MVEIAFLLLILVGFIGAILCSTAVRTINEISWHELEERCDREKKTDWFSEIYESREPMQLGAEILHQFFTVLLVIMPCYWWIKGREIGGLTFLHLGLVLLLVSLLLMLANSWIPWAIARISAVAYLFRTWHWWKLAAKLAWPLMVAGNSLSVIFARASGKTEQEDDDEDAFEDEILSMVSEAEQDGHIESDAREMIEGVMELADTDVSSVMTPRSKVDALHVKTTWEEMMNRIVESGRTRLPIYRESPDDIIGILYSKDLLRESLKTENKRKPLVKLLRRPIFVPEQTRLDQMLNQFLHCRTHMAIVQDEYGGMAGVITIEDVLEEIVGEIVDETDKEMHQEITILNPSQADVDGAIHIYRVNEDLGLQLPDDENFDTISGLIMHHLKEIPRPGTEIVIENVQFNILEGNRRQIKSVRVTNLEEYNRL